ncbi:hypothetical protein Ga0466249_003882 [Sporomusaceae bacterium BoRhaA]|nr:hypothetical protein [Pelorhabdus rhamnosifermentans]
MLDRDIINILYQIFTGVIFRSFGIQYSNFSDGWDVLLLFKLVCILF